MTILFLDFDGVLHPEFCHESRHFSCLCYFETAVRQISDPLIVITSTWRLHRSLDQMRTFFSADIAQLIAGSTPCFSTLDSVPDALLGYEREAECDAWLRMNQSIHRPWFALDDRPWLFRPFSQHLFQVDGETGLTEKLSDSLVARALASEN